MTGNDADAVISTELAEGFRLAMSRLIATVTIITAGNAEKRAGMIATAVMSVSADPPSLAVGVNRDTGVWKSMQDTRRFSVNLLSTHHAGLVFPFSGPLTGAARFTLGEWHTHVSLTPYLADAVVSLFCRVDGELNYGTHTIFVGAVEELRMPEEWEEPVL